MTMEFFNSITQWFRERAVSPLYGTYILSTIAWNWKFFYVLFLQDQAALSVPKIEYVEQKFLSDGVLIHFLWFFVIPAITTYVIVWWVPFVSGWAYRKHLEFYFRKKIIREEVKLAYEYKESRNLAELATIKEEQSTSKSKILKSLPNEELWEEEYKEFMNNKSITESFTFLISCIYQHSGYISRTPGYMSKPEAIAAFDVRNLINFTDFTKNQITLTEKGRFFVKAYLEEHPNSLSIE